MAGRRPTSPIIDLLKRYCHIEDHDDTRTIRAKVTGQVVTLDPVLQDALPALLSLLDALPEDSPFLRLIRSAASAPSMILSACSCARAKSSRCCWSSRTSIG